MIREAGKCLAVWNTNVSAVSSDSGGGGGVVDVFPSLLPDSVYLQEPLTDCLSN